MILADEKHERIHATFKGGDIVRTFKQQLHEGGTYTFNIFNIIDNNDDFKTCLHPYKILFHRGTIVRFVGDTIVPRESYKFESFNDILKQIPHPGISIDMLSFFIP